MGLFELLFIAIGLSMDAFAVSVCKGLTARRGSLGQCFAAGAWFGGFQAGMPFLGYLLGTGFAALVERVDHWIAFALLSFIGGNMVWEALSLDEEEALEPSFGPRAMLPLAVATSIDALAVGVTFAFLQVDILPAAALIGCTTFAFSAAGVKLGSAFGARYKAGAELLGGVVLILMGAKILLEHLGAL